MDSLEDAIDYCRREAQKFEMTVELTERENLIAPEETFREIAEMYRKFAGWFEELKQFREEKLIREGHKRDG